MAKTNLTSSTVRDRFSRQVTAFFARLRDELGETSDQALADRLGLPTTYVHYLTGTRQWPLDAAAKVAAGGQCHIDEMARLAGDPL